MKDSNNPVQSEPLADPSESATGAPAHRARRPVQIRDNGAAECQAARNLEVEIKQALAAGPLSKSTVGELALSTISGCLTAMNQKARQFTFLITDTTFEETSNGL